MRATARSLLVAVWLLTACDKTPEAAADHLRRGDAALADGRFGAALVAYARAHEISPHDPAVQRALMRARVFTAAAGPERIGAENVEEVRYDAQLLYDTDKTHGDVYLTALGNVSFKLGDVEAAKLKFAEAIKENPSSAVAHAALGLALAARKESLGQGKGELELALKLKPDLATALVALGQIKLAEGDLGSASTHLEAALRQGGEYTIHMALGNVRIQQQRPAEAAEQFQRAAQLDPRSAEAKSSLGQALLAGGKSEEAERALRAAAQLRADAATSTALGFALERQKKADQALAVFQQVLAQDGTAAPALFGAGVASEDLGKNDQALDFYRRLAALPEDGPQKQMIAGLRKDAQARITALSAAAPPPAPASVSASAKAPPKPK
jgi:tetratricopeptide (TPR) repeat protein